MIPDCKISHSITLTKSPRKQNTIISFYFAVWSNVEYLRLRRISKRGRKLFGDRDEEVTQNGTDLQEKMKTYLWTKDYFERKREYSWSSRTIHLGAGKCPELDYTLCLQPLVLRIQLLSSRLF